jgi:monoamine oxidase
MSSLSLHFLTRYQLRDDLRELFLNCCKQDRPQISVSRLTSVRSACRFVRLRIVTVDAFPRLARLTEEGACISTRTPERCSSLNARTVTIDRPQFGDSGWVAPAEDFAVDRLFDYPKSLLAAAGNRRQETKRVCIVGAGVAGLTAGYELLTLGHTVKVLERSDRVGGRIRTERFDDGTYGEFGAMRIPVEHKTVMHYIQDLGLSEREFIQENLDGLLLLRGIRTTLARHDVLLNGPQAAFNNIRRSVGTARPSDALDALVAIALGRVSRANEWRIYEEALSDPYLCHLDSTSLWEYLCSPKGLGSNAGGSPLSEEEWEYLGRASGEIWLERISLLEIAVEAASLHSVKKVEIVGGMDRLTDALASRLKGCVATDVRVDRIVVSDDGVEVSWASPDRVTERFDYVICAVPAASTLQIEFEPRLPAGTYEALTNVSYLSSGKTLVHCTERFWETRDHIFGGASYTDLPIQQCWYPSDNSLPSADGSLVVSIPRTPNEAERGLEVGPGRYVAADEQVSGRAAVFTAAYMWGPPARRFAAMTDHERDATVERALDQLHPGWDTTMIEMRHFAWDQEIGLGGGAFAWFGPGERQRYQHKLREPFPIGQPRVFFAGEHVATIHGWIQGAMQTGIGAAIEVLSAP